MSNGEVPNPPLNPVVQPSSGAGLGVWVAAALALLALLASAMVWIKIGSVQELLARQTSDSGTLATEARSSARQAEELARDNAARLALAESKITEINAQRGQLDQLLLNLSRARDENLVADFESALRLAQQQTQLTGSLQPLVAALRTVDQRLSKQTGPRFIALQRAVTRDIERLTTTAVLDTPGLLARLDDLIAQFDTLPLANAVGKDPSPEVAPTAVAGWRRAISGEWWGQVLADVWDDVRGLLRVSRIDQPDAVLLAPEQGFFLRENIKLRLLNARLAVLSRQFEVARADLQTASRSLSRFFDAQSRMGQQAMSQIQQMQGELQQVKLPRIDDTLLALEALAAGR
jgi:uroporphyrin-3 C-methyltransferase